MHRPRIHQAAQVTLDQQQVLAIRQLPQCIRLPARHTAQHRLIIRQPPLNTILRHQIIRQRVPLTGILD